MATTLTDWTDKEVSSVQGESIRFLSERYFFRDPIRPVYSDPSIFFSPADGVVIYQKTVDPADELVEIKGRSYTLQEAMRDPSYDKPSIVIGIFMTFYDVHVNRVPYPGIMSHRELDPIESHNRPMLDMEEDLVNRGRVDLDNADYLFHNQRVLNRVESWELGLSYHILQIADYDVNSITPFDLKPHRSYQQNERFSQIRFGSQVDLIVPLAPHLEFNFLQQQGAHVEGAVDPLLSVIHKNA